ncbi:MAG: antibiotic biosynthesis monooxygenase [Coriobacteriia bacterium]|nr:antibiotic biosynthesis monooxygenase [Coriobacteriia bacterium]
MRRVSDSLLAIRRLERRPPPGQTSGCDVTPAQGALVHEIALAGASGATTGHLAERMRISNSAVTQLVDGLVAGDVVRRDEDLEDRRRVRIRLTERGEDLYRQFDHARTAQTASLLSPLDDNDAQRLADLLERIAEVRQSWTTKEGVEMSVLSTTLYTVATEAEAEQFAAMAPGMSAAYANQPGFERLVVARDVMDPLTIVTMSWWESREAIDAWSKSQDYRAAKSDSGGQGLKAKMEFGRWVKAE